MGKGRLAASRLANSMRDMSLYPAPKPAKIVVVLRLREACRVLAESSS